MNYIPKFVTAIVALVIILEDFFKWPVYSLASTTVKSWGVIVSAFALGVGAVNLFRIHVPNIRRKQNAFCSSVLLIALVGMTATGVIRGASSKPYQFIWQNVFSPLSATVFAILGFLVVSSAYRAFRARNLDSTILLASAFLVLAGLTPATAPIFPAVSSAAGWIMNVVNMAGQRAVMISVGIGSVAWGIRVVLGLERTHGV